MANWRAILGFDERDVPSIQAVHARYRELLVNQSYPLEFDRLRVLSDAFEQASYEMQVANAD